jgi:hypothetical protein
MQRKFESKTRAELFVERVVWNAAAGAALAVMVLLLLVSLQWLDQISPSLAADPRVGGEPVEIARPAIVDTIETDGPTTEVVAVNRPSG